MPAPERKGAPLHLRTDDVAEMIVAAMVRGDKAVAAEYGVAVETIRRYRRRMLADASISAAVSKKREALVAGQWRERMQLALAAGVDFLLRAPAELAHTPEAVRAIAGAVKLMSEAEIQARLLDARVKQIESTPFVPPTFETRPVNLRLSKSREDVHDAEVEEDGPSDEPGTPSEDGR